MPLDTKQLSDRELWASMETGDLWLDAKLHEVWFYLYSNRHLCIPESWQNTMQEFHAEVCRVVTCPQLARS